MLTFIILTRLSPGAARSPQALQQLERKAMERIRKDCPGGPARGGIGSIRVKLLQGTRRQDCGRFPRLLSRMRTKGRKVRFRHILRAFLPEPRSLWHANRLAWRYACPEQGTVKANKYRRLSASNPAGRVGDREQKQWRSSPLWCASRQYRIYSD